MGIIWAAVAINDLKNYELYRKSVSNLAGRLTMLGLRMTAPQTSACSAVPNHGGGNRYEDKLIGLVDERAEVRGELEQAKITVTIIDSALEALSASERLVLDRFYIHRKNDYIDYLCETLHYEQKNVYRIKKEALRKFTIAMYGINA
jgi:hypothetical protein